MLSTEGILVETFNFIGGLICHQLPERTLIMGSTLLPVCARDTGIYIGILAGLALLLMRREGRSGPPNLYLTLAMMLPLIVDGTTQVLGFRTSTNQLRLITGLLFGTAISPFLVYLLPILPPTRKVPILGKVMPTESRLDGKTSWLPVTAFFLGVTIDVGIFFIIDAMAGLPNPWFYWIIALPLMFSLILTIILLPAVVMVSFFDLLRRIKGY